jgi:hypothetical protein
MQVPRMVEELCAGDVSCIPLGFCRAVTNDGDGGWVEIVFPFRAFPKLLGVQIHASSQIDRRAAQQASNDRERIYLLLQEHRLEIGIALGLPWPSVLPSISTSFASCPTPSCALVPLNPAPPLLRPKPPRPHVSHQVDSDV